MATTFSVTGPPALSLTDANGYSIIHFEIGDINWRLDLVSSPWAHGAFLVNAVKDIGSANIAVMVTATTQAILQTRISSLVTAFSNFAYQLTMSADGSAYTWDCLPANIHPLEIDLPFTVNKMAAISITYPRQPVAVAGPL